MTAKASLGRGFDSLIPTDLIDEEFDLTASEEKGELRELKLTDIHPDEDQPRREFNEDALNALAASIKEHGVLQPIVVTREDGKYKIVAGERRWRASKIAGLSKIPAIIRSLDSQNRLELSIIENAQREDLAPLELATAYAKLQSQFNLTTGDIARKVGKSEPSIANYLRLLNLPDFAKKVMAEHKLTEAVMRPLVPQGEEFIAKALPKIIKEGWTSKRVERYVQDTKKKSSASLIKLTKYHKDEDALTAKYGAKVKVSGHSITFKVRSDAAVQDLIKQLLAS